MPERRPDNSVMFGVKKTRDFNIKEVVEDKEPPQKIESIDFGICSGEEIVRNAVMEVTRDDMYTTVPTAPGQPSIREAATNGPLDRRMGTTNKDSKCKTCDEFLTECSGHFGHLQLTLPVFHQGYFKAIIACLSCICKTCSRLLLPPDERAAALNYFRKVQDDHLRRQAKHRAVVDACKKISVCPQCGAANGPIKKVPASGGTRYLLLVHDQYAKQEDARVSFHNQLCAEDDHFSLTRRNPELKQCVGKALKDLDPLTVLNLFRNIPDEDAECLNMRPEHSRPEELILTHLPVPPCCIRPSVAMGVGQGSNEDDLTVSLAEIVKASATLQETMDKGGGVANVMECWGYLQLKIAHYFNSELPGVQQQLTIKQGKRKVMRGFAQRLKGKQGRFHRGLTPNPNP